MLCATEIEVARQIDKVSAAALFPSDCKYREHSPVNPRKILKENYFPRIHSRTEVIGITKTGPHFTVK